ncbi:hypothetical protein IJ00_06295 [Calothrix sp. 336/3]|nr:hypothetical protein IJ00_06295 [Calothrix sp. 336/3]
MKVLVAGCFSIEGGGATAGDLLAAELVCDWLDHISFPYDIAVIPPFREGIALENADPNNYSHVIFVCGPFGRERGGDDFLKRFASCHTIGIDLTMLEPLDQWNPFDVLIERDSSVCARPDITFLSRRELVPVVGVCLVEPYGAAFEEVAYAAVQRLVESRQISVVEIDTRLDENSRGFRSPAEIESILARMDMVITTRLHGTVLSLKNGVPTLSIDPGGDSLKIIRQAETIGWPVVFKADEITDEALQQAFDYCLTEEARMKAKECSERATKMVQEIRDQFIRALTCSNNLASQDNTWIFATTNYAEKFNNTKNNRISADLKLKLSWGEVISQDEHPMKDIKKLLKFTGQKTLPVPIHQWLRNQWTQLKSSAR